MRRRYIAGHYRNDKTEVIAERQFGSHFGRAVRWLDARHGERGDRLELTVEKDGTRWTVWEGAPRIAEPA